MRGDCDGWLLKIVREKGKQNQMICTWLLLGLLSGKEEQ
jgi:hypothetical protein